MSLYHGDMGLCVICDCDTLCWPLQNMLSWHFRNKINVICQIYIASFVDCYSHATKLGLLMRGAYVIIYTYRLMLRWTWSVIEQYTSY